MDFDSEDQKIGSKIIVESVKAPIRQMALNAGESPDLILDMVLSGPPGCGYDFSRGELIQMLEAGIIDPVKVTRVALQNATSVSSTLITTNYAIASEH